MKILISAFSFAPEQGSEAGVGWNLVAGLAKNHQVWVITTNTARSEVQAYLQAHPISNLSVVYFSLPFFPGVLAALQHGLFFSFLNNIYYFLWHVAILPLAVRLHKQENFSLAHHLNWQRYWAPSFLSFLPIPFIWGPVGGGETAPFAFWAELGWRGRLVELGRLILRGLGEVNPFVRYTARASRTAFATTPEAASQMKKIGAQNVKLLSSVAVSEQLIDGFGQNAFVAHPRPFVFISMGRLIAWKGHQLALRALAQIKDDDWEYWVTGTGVEQIRLQRAAKKLGIESKVIFWGQLSREVQFEKLSQSHALVHLALHESGGMAVTEAMAAAKPVICLNLGGPALQVTEECGFRISAGSPQQVVVDAAHAMRQLMGNPVLRQKMGESARERITWHFVWQGHIDVLESSYAEANK